MNWKQKNAEIGIYIEFKGVHNIIQVCCFFSFCLMNWTIMVPLVQFNLHFLENKQFCNCICNQYFKTDLHYYLVRDIF